MSAVLERVVTRNSPRVIAIIDEALKIKRELAPGRYRFPDMRGEKLNAQQYLAAALKNAGADLASIKALHRRIEGLAARQWNWISVFRAKARKTIRATRDDVALTPPTSGFECILETAPENLPLLLIECVQSQTDPLELIALEVWRASVEEPECFGAIDKPWDEHHRRVEALQVRWQALSAELPGAGVMGQDLVVNWISKQKSVAEIRWSWNGQDTQVGAGDPGALDRLVALAEEA